MADVRKCLGPGGPGAGRAWLLAMMRSRTKPRLFDHAVLFEEDRFLRVVGQRDKIELLVRPLQVCGD